MKWEYLVLKRITFEEGVSWMVNSAIDETLGKCDDDECLNKFGNDGWELTAVADIFPHITKEEEADLDSIAPTRAAAYYLKRPKTG
jgi:hypothetical protein